MFVCSDRCKGQEYADILDKILSNKNMNGKKPGVEKVQTEILVQNYTSVFLLFWMKCNKVSCVYMEIRPSVLGK